MPKIVAEGQQEFVPLTVFHVEVVIGGLGERAIFIRGFQCGVTLIKIKVQIIENGVSQVVQIIIIAMNSNAKIVRCVGYF
jgi:hypothetical protein